MISRAVLAILTMSGCTDAHENDPFVVEVDGEARPFFVAGASFAPWDGRLRVDATWEFPAVECSSETSVRATLLFEVDPMTLTDGIESRYEVRGRAQWDPSYAWESARWESAIGGSDAIRRVVLYEDYMLPSPDRMQTFSGVVRLTPERDRVHVEIDLTIDDVAGLSGTSPAAVRGSFDAPGTLLDRPSRCP